MIRFLYSLLVAASLAVPASLAGDPGAPPFKPGERLRYEVVWPSGLSLGEAEFHAQPDQKGWRFKMSLSANLPTLEIRDEYRSATDPSLCSREFEKDAQRGPKKIHELVTFDQDERVATRETLDGGGSSDLDVPPCARDALAFLYFLRQDIAQGRIPPPDDVNFGGQYMISVTYAETRPVDAAGKRQNADRILLDVSGPESQHSLEIFFGRDDARTPLVIRVPFEMGVFSLRLVE